MDSSAPMMPPPPPSASSSQGPPLEPAPAQQRLCGGMAPSMVSIMEGQVEEMRKVLMRFKVLASPSPLEAPVASAAAAAAAPPGAVEYGQEPMGAGIPAQASLPAHADILVFGPSGSGKSSLIRTFYRALHKTQEVPEDFAERIIVKDTAMNEGTLKYISATIKPPKLDHRGAVVSSAIMCHDTRGHIWMDEREQKQLGVIMDGAVKDESLVQQRNYRYARLLWEFWRRDVDLFPTEILVKKNGGLSTKPHAILFVFDGSMEEIPDGEEETRFYKDVIAMSRNKGYLYPQIVLTRIDRVEENLVKSAAAGEVADPELRLRQVLDKKIEDVVMKLDIPRTAVHFIENYHAGTGNGVEGRNVSVDFHALKILTQCCSNADAFVAQSLHTASRPPGGGQCSLQ